MAKKPKKLSDIKIKEVSMVDLPANKSPFLFWKRADGQRIDALTKKKKMNINIESDGTAKGTAVSIDGKSLGTLRDFNFSFWGTAKGSEPVSCSYSKVVEAEDGFKRTETFYLSKGEIIMSKELLKKLQEYFGTEDIDFEKKVDEDEVQKALALITKEYKETLPEDLENAIGVLAKRAASSYDVKKESDEDVNKAGAKFSKDVIKKLKAIIDSIQSLIGETADGSTEKSEGGDNKDELSKQIAELKEVIAKGSDNELKQTVEDLKKQIETLEKGGVKKTSLSDQDTGDDDDGKGAGEKGEHLWPTITGQGKA